LRHVGIVVQKNALKAFCGYARHDLNAKIPIKRVEAWASWAERYGEICLHMRPFRRIWYNQMQGYRHLRANRHISVSIDDKARRTVRLYAALLTLSLIHGLPWFVTGRGDCPPYQELLVIESLLGGAAVDCDHLTSGGTPLFRTARSIAPLSLAWWGL
jgi:hypothetical protein